MEHLKAYILALKNMNTDFTIRIAQQSDALELMSLFQETVLHINKRDYSEAEVADWASCGNDLSHIKDMIKTHYLLWQPINSHRLSAFHPLPTKDICILCLFIKIFKVKALLPYF